MTEVRATLETVTPLFIGGTDPLAGPGLPTGAAERRYGLRIAQDVNGLQESFEPFRAEQHGLRGPVLRDGNDVIRHLEIPDQVQEPSFGLRDGDEAIYLLHGNLLWE